MLRSNRHIAAGDIKANTGQVALTGVLCRHRLIFPGRFQPSIVSTDELNCRVRDGNGWTLIAKDTDCFESFSKALFSLGFAPKSW